MITIRKNKAFTIWTRDESWKAYVPETQWDLEEHVQGSIFTQDIAPLYKVLRLKAQEVLHKHGVMSPPSSRYRARVLLKKLKSQQALRREILQKAHKKGLKYGWLSRYLKEKKLPECCLDDLDILNDYIKVWDAGSMARMGKYLS